MRSILEKLGKQKLFLYNDIRETVIKCFPGSPSMIKAKQRGGREYPLEQKTVISPQCNGKA